MRLLRKAFTLSELVVVVVILGVLTAIAILGYTQYVQNSKNTAAMAMAVEIDNQAMAIATQGGYQGLLFSP